MGQPIQRVVRDVDPRRADVVLFPQPFPKREHVARHLNGNERAMRAFVALIQPGTIDDVARRFGPGETRRTVEYQWLRHIAPAFGMGGLMTNERLRLCRIAYGIDPCWCEQ